MRRRLMLKNIGGGNMKPIAKIEITDSDNPSKLTSGLAVYNCIIQKANINASEYRFLYIKPVNPQIYNREVVAIAVDERCTNNIFARVENAATEVCGWAALNAAYDGYTRAGTIYNIYGIRKDEVL